MSDGSEWQATPELRLVDGKDPGDALLTGFGVAKYWVLQQRWREVRSVEHTIVDRLSGKNSTAVVYQETGKYEWRDVPTARHS